MKTQITRIEKKTLVIVILKNKQNVRDDTQ